MTFLNINRGLSQRDLNSTGLNRYRLQFDSLYLRNFYLKLSESFIQDFRSTQPPTVDNGFDLTNIGFKRDMAVPVEINYWLVYIYFIYLY